jgi:ABC-type amino acid transport substrate-binding protein
VLGFTPFHWYPIIEQKKIRLFESNDVRIVLKQVLLERVDGADMELSVAAYQLNRLQQTGKLVFDPALPFIVAPFYFSTIKHPAVIEQFNRFLHSEKPEIDRIRERHGILDAESVLNHAQ